MIEQLIAEATECDFKAHLLRKAPIPSLLQFSLSCLILHTLFGIGKAFQLLKNFAKLANLSKKEAAS